MSPSKSKTNEQKPRPEGILEAYGVDNFLLSFRDEEALHIALTLIEEFLNNCCIDGGSCPKLSAAQHSRSYGPYTRFTVEFVVQIPRQTATIELSKGTGRPGQSLPQAVNAEVATEP